MSSNTYTYQWNIYSTATAYTAPTFESLYRVRWNVENQHHSGAEKIAAYAGAYTHWIAQGDTVIGYGRTFEQAVQHAREGVIERLTGTKIQGPTAL